MHLPIRCSQQIALLLLLFLSLLLHPCAAAVVRRGDYRISQPGEDDDVDPAPTLDGPTADGSPGIGVEFETFGVIFESEDCRLSAEYILDGTQIKLDTGKAAEATAGVANDISDWNPFKGMQDPKVDVVDSTCNPWTIIQPSVDRAFPNLEWAMQVTAPLPLEAIHDLFRKAIANEASPLLPMFSPATNMVFVTTDFFQSKPNGISKDSVGDDVLGFFSLLISYAKRASRVTRDNSPKTIISIMPRTDWTTVPGQVYELVKVLACYKHDGKEIKLSEADKVIDGSVGGLGKAFENVLGTNRAVPLFEFRKLAGVRVANMEDKVTQAEQAIIDNHRKFGKAPQLFKQDEVLHLWAQT
ncbi:MAG: hypothetical protein Q9176_008112 [Flavoplaca citrina]